MSVPPRDNVRIEANEAGIGTSDTSSVQKEGLSEDLSRNHVAELLDGPDAWAAAERAVFKMDLTLIPLITMFYLLSFLDRANIGNARVAGLQKGLNMTDHQYSICVTITYIPYILSEIPSNLLLRRIGPNIVLPVILTTWGVITVLQGFVSSFQGLATVRAFLGLVEGPMFPAIVLYLSGFYTRKDLSLRIGFFFSAASLSGAFSGLLAAAISKMNGLGGRPSWSWIFILEGLFTVCFGVVSFWLVPRTPMHSPFLTQKEKDLIMARLENDRPFINPVDKFEWSYVFRAFKSPHRLLLFAAYFFSGTNLYGLALFLPSIVSQLGHSPNRSQLLSVGPFGVAFILTVALSWTSDRMKNRFIPLCTFGAIGVAGYVIYLSSHSKAVMYGALYLIVPGVYACTPVISAWLANNSEPHYTRATGVAAGLSTANFGGILSTWLYPTREGPRFTKTTSVNLALQIAGIVVALVNAAYLHDQNRRKKENRAALLEKYDTSKQADGGVQAWVDLGDRHPDFPYMI